MLNLEKNKPPDFLKDKENEISSDANYKISSKEKSKKNREIILELQEALKKGNPTQTHLQYLYQSLISINIPDFYRFLGHFWHNYSDFDDILQEFWIVLLKDILKFDAHKDFTPWAFSILNNIAHKFYRKKKSEIKANENWHNYTKNSDLNNNILDSNISNMLFEEIPSYNEKILLALKNLKPEEYELIFLRYFEDYSMKDLEVFYKKSRSTLQERLSKIRKKLKKLILAS